MTYGYEQALARRAADAHPVLAGGSGYFAHRGTGLDPHLFEFNDHLRPDVRRTVLQHFYSWCHSIGLVECPSWSQLWLAGSGITTAWDADREAGDAPGDLDTLIGIDYVSFASANPSYRGSQPHDIAHHLNQSMHDHLWPGVADIGINGKTYELTYYVNDGVGAGEDDLLGINPYAAYNVTKDKWTLHPVQVPDDFSPEYFSVADRQQVQSDLEQAQGVLNRFQIAQKRTQDSPQDIGGLRYLHEVVASGAKLFSAIHDGRKAAFAPGGEGYFDRANFRWQAAKGNGAITVLRALKQLDEQAHADANMPCSDVGHLLLMAALANGR